LLSFPNVQFSALYSVSFQPYLLRIGTALPQGKQQWPMPSPLDFAGIILAGGLLTMKLSAEKDLGF
jgi:hypothetical protein